MVVLSLDKIFLRSVVTEKLFLSLGGLLLTLSTLCYGCLNLKENFEIGELFVQYGPRITLLCTFLCFGSVLWKIRHSIEEIWSSITENTDFFNVFHIVMNFCLCLCLFSNSYVVEESYVYSFSASSLVILHLYKNNLIFESKRHFFLGLLFLGNVNTVVELY